jgi:hypothetical protein
MRCIVKRPGHPAWARLSLAASLLVSGCIAGCDGPGDGDRTRLLRIWSRTSHAEQVSVSSDESQVVIFTGGLDQRVVCFDVDPWRKKWSRRVGDDFSGGASVAWSSGEVVVFGDNCGAYGVLAADGRVRVPFRSTGLRCSESIVSAPLGDRVGVGQGRSKSWVGAGRDPPLAPGGSGRSSFPLLLRPGVGGSTGRAWHSAAGIESPVRSATVAASGKPARGSSSGARSCRRRSSIWPGWTTIESPW